MKHETLTFRFLDMSRGGVARLFLLLLLPCLSVIGVKADSNGGVKFNSGVRYSQWAINSRLYDFRGNQKAYGFKKWNSNTESLGEYANNMKLDYVAGLVGKATLEASDYYIDFDWAKPWFKSAQAYATDYPYSAQEKAKMTLDNMNAAKMAFHIINNNNSEWGEDAAKTKAKNAIEAIITDLKYYNEYNVIGGTNSEVKEATANDVQKKMLGGWFHKYNYVDQVWCDGMYMGPALLAQIIKHTGKTNNISDNDWDIIAKQFSITWAQLYDKNTGLLYHGFTANPGDDASKSWAGISKEKGIYHSASFWGRANAWYFLALVDILEVMPKDNTYYNTFKNYLSNLATGIAKYQDETTGCWYQVMDKVPASLTGNYLEASCSSIFTAGYLKAIRLGLLDKTTYEPIAKKAYEGLVNQFMVYDNKDNSTIQLVHSCTSAGLGGSNNRAGNDNYYLTGKDAKVVTSSDPASQYYYTEGKVLGGFIMAATEYERAYQNQNPESKQILFAKDLAPSYDFTTTDGKLDATAYGSVDGNITYQWYKDGYAIATSATYTPTESGSYYCKATANGNTIKTSTTTVTAKSNSNTDKGKIKPVFLESFKGITINLHQDSNNRTITVPLIYNGEDVSSYFIYTYTITPTDNTSSVTGSTLNFTPETAGTYSVTVSATPDSDGTNDYSDVYDNPDAITFTLSVDSKNQTISVTPDPTSIKMYAGTTRVAPDLTVTTENTTLADTEYNTLWFSTSPGIVKVDAKTGKIEAVSEGTAKIRVVVTGDNLESTTALITVEVDDPAMYRVKGPESDETYGNQKRMWNQDKTLSVVLGGWLFPNPVATNGPTSSPKGPSTEGLSADFHWGTDKNLSSLPKWKLTGFDYYVVGDKNKNARQENGSNALPETTNIYSADFKSYTGTIKDKMFNVPCSGSFLEFNPATNGKVTVHIFQNGVFDCSNKEYVYRPQRRVFVMDEAGNFVSSNAHIESTNGKPTGGIQPVKTYTWDVDNSKELTIEDVRSHFKGIPTTFDMTAEAFKNNVYESNLSTDLVPNAAAGKGNGSMGWSVLADSPVTYTFNVKAGKTYYLYNFGSKIGFYGFSFDEGEIKPIVDVKDYDAETANANNVVEKTLDGHVAQVKIERKMVANRWTTCVLPFSLNRQQVDAIFGPAYSATAKEGTQILYFDHVEGNKAYFVRHAYNTIVAGKPFLIKPTKDVESINTADVTDYPYVTIENTKPDDWCESNGYVWTSSYNKMNIVKNDYFIGASDGNFKAYAAASGTVKGFRGFLKANLPEGAKPAMLSISTSSITDGNDGETTGIEDLIINADGELIPANCRVYNINGQLVSEDANSFQSLPSGIYIINGKKYIK